MTAQVSDRLINEHPTVDLDGLYVYGVIRGDPTSNSGWGEKYIFDKQPKDTGWMTSACWRGHISTYRLCEDGHLKLIGYEYRGESEEFEEVATGDFWLVMKMDFEAPRIYAQFRDGKIDDNFDHWLVEADWLPLRERFIKALEEAKTQEGKERRITLSSPKIRGGQTFSEWLNNKTKDTIS